MNENDKWKRIVGKKIGGLQFPAPVEPIEYKIISGPADPEYEPPQVTISLFLKTFAGFLSGVFIGFLGMLILSAIVLGIFIIIFPGLKENFEILVSICSIVGSILMGIWVAYDTWQFPKKDSKRWWKEKIAQNERERINVRKRCCEIIRDIHQIQQELPDILNETIRLIGAAHSEYTQRAFKVMFNYIESAFENLERFHEYINNMKDLKQEYKVLLSEYKHTFPSISPPPEDILKAAKIAFLCLTRVVRKGETNPQCTSIWLQIETIDVLISGFASLAEALQAQCQKIISTLNGICSHVDQGIKEFSSTTASGLAEIAKQQAKTTKTINSWGTINLIEMERIRRSIEH